MTKNKLILSLLGLLATAVTLLITYFTQFEEQPLPPVEQKTYVLDSFERPEFALDSQWKGSLSRTLLEGHITSVIAKSAEPCSLVSVPGAMLMVPVTTTRASAPTYQVGTYYDALRPLTQENCAQATYIQVDVQGSMQIGDAQITITKKPAQPQRVNLHVSFDNWGMVLGYCGGQWCAAESSGPQGSKLLVDHRISPYNIYPGGTVSWDQYVVPFSLIDTGVAFGAVPGYLSSAPLSRLRNPWAYVFDEPRYWGMNDLAARLSDWRTRYPGVKRMVTTPLRHKDLNPTSPTFAKIINHRSDIAPYIDIHAPVAEEFCQESWAGSGDRFPCREDYRTAGKQLWLYVSNMSHGSENGNATGAPDLVIDRSAVEVFGFYLLAVKYELDGLLYYNSIENWHRQDVWADPYILGGNGDGLLIYPDVANKQAMPSIRLKLIREASQWADIILAAGIRDQAAALMTDSLRWDRDLKKFEDLRTQALSRL